MELLDVYQHNEYTIKIRIRKHKVDAILFKDNRTIGKLLTRRWNEKYLIVYCANIKKKYRGLGFGKQLYKAVLEYAPECFDGLMSNLSVRTNNLQVPKIWNGFGGYEINGYAFIDRIK